MSHLKRGLGMKLPIKRKSNDEDFPKRHRRTKRLWSCKRCKETFATSTLLRKHRSAHRKQETDSQYNYRFDDKRDLFVCGTCDLETADKREMDQHVLVHEDKFACRICGKEFVKPYEYSCHMYNHDQAEGFPCPLCNFSACRRTNILTHINTYHLGKYLYTCTKCGKGFNDCVMYKEHDNVHQGIKPFRCVVCSKSFTFSSYLTTHQIRYHRVIIDGTIGVNQCPVCRKSFSRGNTLEKHMKRHQSEENVVREKKHLCDVCGKDFTASEKLRVHYRVHTGVKPFTCSYCAKSFTMRQYLIMHERVHSGEKPYSCEHCGKCFNQAAPLRIHVRTHTGERPYVCHICKAGFVSKGVLKIHFQNCPGIHN